MGDVLDDLRGLFRRDCVDDADLDPLGELVHRHQDVLVAVMVVLNGPTESRPHIAKGQEGGIVLRT
jgi:hypothetical protein